MPVELPDDIASRLTAAASARGVRPEQMVIEAGSAIIMGSAIGAYLDEVVAWDFEASDDDPMVVLDLVPPTPQAVERALARTRTSAA